MIPCRYALHGWTRVCLLAALGIACISTTGCAIAVSKNPLSDEKTSRIDERLIGKWQLYEEQDKEKKKKEILPQYAVGRMKGKKNTLEMVFVDVDEKGRVKVSRDELFCKTVGMRSYASLHFKEDGKEDYFIIYLYKFSDKDTLKLYFLDGNFVGPDIESGLIKGTFEKKKRAVALDPNRVPDPEKGVEVEYEDVQITASSEELIAYIKKRGPACFNDQPLTLLRVQR